MRTSEIANDLEGIARRKVQIEDHELPRSTGSLLDRGGIAGHHQRDARLRCRGFDLRAKEQIVYDRQDRHGGIVRQGEPRATEN